MTSVTDARSGQKRLVATAVIRGFLTAALLIALYYLLPLGLDDGASAVLRLTIGFFVFLGLMAWQLRAIAESQNPGLRALEGVFLVLPLFILLFATAYYAMSRADEANFTASLSRTDALYFTVTIFSTVGFGDISARAEAARLIVTMQMILDLIILGLGVRIILNAVQRGRDRLTSQTSEG